MRINSFRFDPASPLFLHSADGVGTGGDENPNPNPNPETPEQRDERIAMEVKKKFDAQSAKHSGDLTAALLDQIRKTHSAENGQATLQRQFDQLKAQLPDEATKAKYAAYEALGSVEEITKRLEAGEAAIVKSTEQERKNVLSEAGYDAEKFADLEGNKAWSFAFREEQKDGKTVKVPIAKIGDEAEKLVSELIAEKYPRFVDSLKLGEVQRGGTSHVRQGSGDQDKAFKKPEEAFVAAREQQNKEKTNPLMG